MSNELAVAEKPRSQVSVLFDMSSRFGMDPTAFELTVRATCSPTGRNARALSREEFAAFLLVAKNYNLNPLTREIYAFPKTDGGIVPVVSIDGWVNLINSHPQCDGWDMEATHDEKGALVSMKCTMYRKDRARPVVVEEYLAECKRDTVPWNMKHRMLRHKTLIQAGRYAFGFSGIYDEDEAERIVQSSPVAQLAPPPPNEIQQSAAPSNVSRVVAADAGGEQIYQGSSSSPAHIEHDGPDWEKLVSDFEAMCKTGKKYDLLEEERDAIIALDQLPREFALRAQNALEGAANRIDEEEAEAERKRVADAEAKAAKAAAVKAKKAAAADADAAPKQQADQAPPPPTDGDDFPGDKPAATAPPPPKETAPTPAEVDMALAAQRDPAAIVRQLARQKAKNGTKRFNMWFGSLSDEDTKIVEEMTDMDEQIRVAEAADAAAKAAEANGG